MAKWTAADIPAQSGRTVVVTGANSGLGAATARELARAGAHVIIACRNVSKGEAAAATMAGTVEVRPLDLADLSSIRSFASTLSDPFDVLINNAGVMALPLRRTADGFEMQIGTNHLGHFALTGLLLDRIRDKVVTVSSGVHRLGRIRLDDLNWESGRYQRWLAYAQSKLANLLFTYELSRRLTAAGSPVKSLAAHPGYAATNLQSHTESIQDKVMSLGNRLAQSAEMGALPTLYAATMDVPTATYLGPDGFMENRGHPKVVRSNAASHNEEVARRLWELSEHLTDVIYKLTPQT
ncbi:MAG TPA: oxidoreductase [Actinophytocola sp.]|jgi:NAD(P)-dependent dehydrogenase (short-subunit alcohol dehydrogenase family)|uniref:oxidoreductase n=1 Tax=Actinophytocola sp. TaxID=1872138 RepID=UPI002DFCDC24|nr:oxidoreductase [Actinophytocola sp.]